MLLLVKDEVDRISRVQNRLCIIADWHEEGDIVPSAMYECEILYRDGMVRMRMVYCEI